MLHARTAPPPPSPASWFSGIDRDSFCALFNRRAFRFRHALADHPLLADARLDALARALPPEQLELNAGDVPPSLVERRAREELSAAEALAAIETCRTWVGLKEIERDPEYRALVDQALGELEPWIAAVEPGVHLRQGWIFVSSPGTVVPFHFDPEHGFLLQIRGRKRMICWDKTDAALVSEVDRERQHGDPEHPRKLELPADAAARGEVFELAPGDALHVPVGAPHWVETLDEPSVSLSLTFRTAPGERRARLYRMNHALRALGLRPAPVGASPARDAVKYAAYRLARGAARLLRR